VRTAFRTDIGRVRSVNEDRVLVIPDLNGFTLAIVADGMGGHQAGDIASQLAVETIENQLRHLHRGMTLEACESALKQAIVTANRTIFNIASAGEKYAGMGTTVVLALATRQVLMIAHIGDSRAYICSGLELEQLTQDHSLVNELVKTGQISEAEAQQHPRRNVLTRALGTDPDVEVDVRHFSWKAGDMVLMCSDGLSGLVNAERLCGILNEAGDLEMKADRLIQTALQAGGDDNITAVILSNEPPAHSIGGDTE
jgi:serine/threonine protein phosphatase PrpC